jgi:integrase
LNVVLLLKLFQCLASLFQLRLQCFALLFKLLAGLLDGLLRLLFKALREARDKGGQLIIDRLCRSFNRLRAVIQFFQVTMDRGFRAGVAHFYAYCIDARVFATSEDRGARDLHQGFGNAATGHVNSYGYVLWYMPQKYAVYHPEYKVKPLIIKTRDILVLPSVRRQNAFLHPCLSTPARKQPMSDLDRYLQAATRDNTRRSYRAAIEHFEVKWGGFLPATADSVARYLVAHAEELSINTLKLRLSALAQWHNSQGFADPTKAPVVRKVFKGIRALHPAQEKQAEPLQLQDLQRVIDWLEHEVQAAREQQDRPLLLKAYRDRALILLGFWRGFRSDELCRLQIEHVQAQAGKGITLYLPRSKGDRENLGQTYQAPALLKLCPVQAYIDWITEAALVRGPVFRSIDRWGNLNEEGLHANSIIPLLRQALQRAGIAAENYTSHSLRRGFATWAHQSGWDLKSLMSYVGWKDMKSAMRYVEASPFQGMARITDNPASS